MASRGGSRSSSSSSSSRRQSTPTWTSAFRCQRVRLNCLWSIWYCLFVLAFEIYLTAQSIQQFTRYIALPWPDDSSPFLELNAYVGFVGAAVVLLPFFVVAAVIRVGNLANDGYKLGGGPQNNRTVMSSKCHKAPMAVLRTIWRNSGPLASFLHIISAFCLLFPKVLIQAKLIKHGFLHKDEIWRTDLDFMITHKDRIVVLSFLAANNHSGTSLGASPDDLVKAGNGGVGELSGGNGGVGTGGQGRSFDELTPISPEFFNYAVALLVYSVRYPAVFWETNKSFGFLFSVQLVLASLQSLLAFTGFSVFYKLNAYGADAVISTTTNDDFMLSRPMAVVLYVLSNTIVGLSGSVVYFYGLRKFQGYVVREREKHHISWRESSRTLWGYMPHCLAFVVLMFVAIITCPLLHDYTLVYKGSLDGSILACVVGTIMFMFLWIVLWLTLTLKQQWYFHVQPGMSSLCNGKATKLHNDIELQRHKHPKNAPIIVICGGQTYTIKEVAPKKAIMNVVVKNLHQQKHLQHQQQQQQQQQQRYNKTVREEDDIYWLKPKPPSSPRQSPENERLLWTGKKKSPNVKHKVTFEDTFLSGSPRKGKGNGPKSPKATNKSKKQQSVKFEDLTDTDEDGDYATLRDIPLIREVDEEDEHEASLQRLLEVHEEEDEEDENEEDGFKVHRSSSEHSPSGYVDSGRMCHNVKSPVHQINVAVTVHDESPSPQALMCSERLVLLKTAPPSSNTTTNRDEEGHEVVTTRSNSLTSSCSPPEKGASSDTSSGIHSSSSICDNNSTRKSSSMDDLLPLATNLDCGKPEHVWKSMSLQRTPSNYSSSSSCSSTVPRGMIDGGGTSPCDGQDSAVLILRKKQTRLKSDELKEKQEPFGRATNMRLTSFTDPPVTVNSGGSPYHCGISNVAIAPSKLIYSRQHLPLTSQIESSGRNSNTLLGHLTSSNRGTSGHQRDSANYSLTSSGDSDNYLSHA